MRSCYNDIEKYLKGELSAREMHRLEKQALTDPFLADALEGATTIHREQFSQDVDEFNRKIDAAAKRSTLVWPLRIAASLALIAVISLAIYTWEYPAKDNLAVNNEMREGQAEEVQTDGKQADEQVVDGGNNKGIDDEVASATTSIDEKEEKPGLAKGQPEDKADKRSTEITEAPVSAGAAIKAATQAEDLAVVEEKSAEEIVVQELQLDVAPAEAEKAEDRSVKRRSQAILESAAPNKGYPAGKGKAQPGVGDEGLQDYLQQHVQYPRQALDNKTEGWVSILFVVLETGELTGFTVTQSIGYGCEEAVIEAIKGILWKPAQDEQGKPVADSVVVNYRFSLPR